MEEFDLEATMRKHEESLKQFREKVERDQRDAGLLPAGASLGGGGGADASLGGFGSMAPAPERDEGYGFDPTYKEPALGGGEYFVGEDPLEQFGYPTPPPAAAQFGGPAYDAKFIDDRKKPVAMTPPAGMKPRTAQVKDTPIQVRNTPKTAHPLRVYDRVSQWARRREQKLDEERRKNEEKKVAGCPFTPQTRSTKAPYAWEQKSGSIYGGTGRAWGYDEFVERQREARRRANEKREMNKYTGKNWTNEVTVCQEFQLGRRDRSIKALQKPLSPPSFVPTVSEHHHLAKEATGLADDSPLAILQGSGLPQRGLFSERISTAIIDNTMLNPADGGYTGYEGGAGERMQSVSPNIAPGAFSSPGVDSEWAKRSSEKQSLEAHLNAHTTRPWRADQ